VLSLLVPWGKRREKLLFVVLLMSEKMPQGKETGIAQRFGMKVEKLIFICFCTKENSKFRNPIL
jgi:hypothetical protein